jgi:hypothetical protein
VLPSARKLNKKKGHASVPYPKAPQLMTKLRHEIGNSARCVEVGMLTLTRSQEIRWMGSRTDRASGLFRRRKRQGPALLSGERRADTTAPAFAGLVLVGRQAEPSLAVGAHLHLIFNLSYAIWNSIMKLPHGGAISPPPSLLIVLIAVSCPVQWGNSRRPAGTGRP